jgi:pimeloyl-ACP methyl ester carboxylesterase
MSAPWLRGPLLVAVDDAQWLDRGSLDALGARRPPPGIGTSRAAARRAKIYPDAAHGFLWQHHAEFAADVTEFLS